MDKRRILLVDNNEIIRLFFKDVFWMHGLDNRFQLEFATNLEEAQTYITNNELRPDIIFLDLVMPAVHEGGRGTSVEAGFSFLESIKRNPLCAGVQIIIFSSEKSPELETHAKSLGAMMYLKKGENLPQDLVAVIEKL